MGVFSLVVCSTWSAAARAEEPRPAARAARPAEGKDPAIVLGDGADLLAQARELYVEGAKAARSGQAERARLFYTSAWRAQRHWQIAGSLGHVELALGRYRDAAEHLAFFLRETRDLASIDPRDRAALTADLEHAKAKIGVVTAVVEPLGAEVLVDGAPLGKAPLADPIFVDPGRHVFEARAPGRPVAVEARDLVAGGEVGLTLRVVPTAIVEAQAAPPPAPPPVQAAPPPPLHGPRANRAIVIGGTVATGVLLTVGVGLAVGSAVKASASRDCEVGPCQGVSSQAARRDAFDQLQSQKVSLGYASIGTFVGAGVIGVGTAAYALLANKRLRMPRTGLVVYPGGAAASVSGDW